jgi:1-acyl-sn-glycerol-3-phosphate acyltransferase
MTTHSDNPSTDVVEQGSASNVARASESNTRRAAPRLSRRLFYWWSLFVAGALLLIIGPPVIFTAWLARRRHWVYPFGLFGARTWLKLSGVEVRVRGLEYLDARQTYVFISNHRSYLDTAALFNYTGRRIGLLAKKELLKVPILGYGMGYVNIMAIDRRSRESAIRTVRAATERIHSGISFGVFAEGTRARPGQLLPFKKGAFYMAIEAGVPVVPIVMKNTDVLMGKGTGEAQPGTMEMVLLPPIETAGLSTDEDVKRLIERVHSSIAEELAKPIG